MDKKRYYPLIPILFLLHPALAQQPADYQFQFHFENNLKEWTPGSDGHWFGVGWSVWYPSYPMGIPFVIKWNPQTGNIVWEKEVPMPLAETVWNATLLPADDGGIYVGAVFDGCDYGTPDGLARLDAAGNILWTVQTPEGFGWENNVWLLPHEGGGLYFQTEQYRIEFDAGGNLKEKITAPFHWGGISPRQEGGYLFYGNKKIGIAGPSLDISESPFSEDIVHAVQLPSGNWLLLGKENLFRLGADLSILDQQPVSEVASWSKIFDARDRYFLGAEDISGHALLHQIDTATLAILNTYDQGDNYRLKSVIPVPGSDRIWLSGEANFKRNQTVFLASVPDDNPVITPDRSVALTDIRLEQTPAVVWNPCDDWNTGNEYEIRFGKVSVTVKNTGKEPVQKFRVNGSFSRCNFICEGSDQISKEFNLTLLPGDSVDLQLLNDFRLYGQYLASSFDLCFWTAMPDERLDSRPDDDERCEVFPTITVDAPEPAAIRPAVRVFPNPASDRIHFQIEAPEDPGTVYVVTLSDLSGRTVTRNEFSGPTHSLPRESLAAGIYLYEISDRNGIVGKGKVVLAR